MVGKLSIIASLAVAACAHGAGTLVAHWKFDETSGATAADSGPNAAHGVLEGAAAFVSGGVSGNAVRLSTPTNDHVRAPFVPHNSTPFSIGAWVRCSDQDEFQLIAGRHRSGLVQGYFLALNTSGTYGQPGKAYAYVSALPGTEPISTTTVADGQWRHVLMTHGAGDVVSLYIDGRLEASSASAYVPTGVPFLIGALTLPGGFASSAFDGDIDDVQFYSGVLNGRQICHIVNNPGSAAAPNIDGDINGDGAVNFADLNIILSGFNMTGFCLQGDVDGDGVVGFADLNRLLSNFNSGG
ncbi:MAG: LamG domain-containing protein [Phycisphaerales bacterium]|nr:LamG domain-containing protein [Phycisphaerales bacterium]